MFHSRLFATTPTYRSQSFQAPLLDCSPLDRPTFVQFCANSPPDLLAAAHLVAPHCDAVDLNLGCPQGIARKGRYGAFLQDDWSLITALISTLNQNLPVPVTAKIRILDTPERSLEYARMVVAAGATVLTVHGRTREQKGHNTGMADWDVIAYLRTHLPREIVVFANGNVLWQEDVARCIAATGVDGVMSAEGNLHNPAVFQTSGDWSKRFPRVDVVAREYLGIVRAHVLPHLDLTESAGKKSKRQMEIALMDPSLTPIKSHLFKLWHTLLPRHTRIRDLLARSAPRIGEDVLAQFEAVLEEVGKVVADELEANPEHVGEDGMWVGPDTPIDEKTETDGKEGIVVEVPNADGTYRKVRRVVPWYRCQPYYRPLPAEAIAKGAMTARKKTKKKDAEESEGGKKKKMKLEEEIGA